MAASRTDDSVRISTVALTGATGFVGRHMARELLSRGYRVRALVRDRQKAREVLPASGGGSALELVSGDALDAGALADLVGGTQACIHLVGILREKGGQTFKRMHPDATAAALQACGNAGVKRFLHMSALKASDTGATEYQRSKFEAERLVRRSGLDWTIFRPGLIHGPGGEFVEMASDWVTGHVPPYIFMPYFTRWQIDTSVPLGTAKPVDPKVAPIAVEDVCKAFVESLTRQMAIGEVYNLVGGETLSWPQMLTTFRDNVSGGNERLHPWGVPSEIASKVAMVADLIGLGGALPFDEGMAVMGGQDATASMEKARAHLGVEPKGFTETFKRYAGSL